MGFDVTLMEGAYLVRLARRSIEARFRGSDADISDASATLRQPCGAFVTLNKVRGGAKALRGCIGYPTPVKPLAEAVREVAQAAAFEDPRFPELQERELPEVQIEVSVLTPPEPLNVGRRGELPLAVRVGVDGLIVRRGWRSGLLLPQVAVEWEWGPEEFLSQCCVKAGLQPDAWLLEGTDVSVFQAIVFAERSPGGEVFREELG